jgi:hypothetical protein
VANKEAIKTDNKRLKRIWYGMIYRCYGEKVPEDTARYYRDKGITVCDAWKDKFEEFEKWAMENGYSDELTIDRIDADKNYCPENCQWITRIENAKKAVEDRRKKPISEHRSDVGHFMVIEKLQEHFFGLEMYKVIRTGLYKEEANALVKKLNSELPYWERRYYARVTLNCKVGQKVLWEQTGQYLNSKKLQSKY